MRAAFPLGALAVVLAAAACTRGEPARDAAPDVATAAPATAATAAPATTSRAPSTVATPATVARPAPAVAPGSGPTPAPGAITFLGFGPAHWGASLEQLLQAWGGELEASPGDPGGCRYLFPLPRSEAGYRVAFMIEGGRFVRTDVRAPEVLAPGGGRVGLDRDALRRLYPEAVEMPHKYVEGGLVLRAMDPAGGQGVAVFELDPAGRVTAWRVGVPPQVDYVEGCS